jgi:hypothetical protein
MSQTSTPPPRKQEPVSVAYAPPKRTWRRRLAHSLRAWSRTTFSRESYIASAKSLLWVVPLTVLIWIYAEREQVTTLPNVTINVAPPVGVQGRLLAHFAPGTIHTIHAELKGPQSSAEEAKEILEANTITLDLERDLTPGDHTIVIADVLNRDPRIIAKGAEVRNCVPAEVTVTVEKLSPHLLDVKVKPEDAKGLPPLAFQPPKVQVMIPDSEYNKAETDNRLYVYPNLKPFADDLAKSGEQTLHNVAVLLAFEDPLNAATVTPPTVNATFNRTTTEDRYPYPPMAVFAAYPFNTQPDKLMLFAKYEPLLSGVTLVGPVDKIQQIKNGEVVPPPHATFDVDLSGNPQPQQARRAKLSFVLPPGVRVELDAPDKEFIDYYLVPRNPAQ